MCLCGSRWRIWFGKTAYGTTRRSVILGFPGKVNLFTSHSYYQCLEGKSSTVNQHSSISKNNICWKRKRSCAIQRLFTYLYNMRATEYGRKPTELSKSLSEVVVSCRMETKGRARRDGPFLLYQRDIVSLLVFLLQIHLNQSPLIPYQSHHIKAHSFSFSWNQLTIHLALPDLHLASYQGALVPVSFATRHWCRWLSPLLYPAAWLSTVSSHVDERLPRTYSHSQWYVLLLAQASFPTITL